MSLKFGNSNVTQVKFGPNTSSLSDVNKIVFNNAVAWCRPFTLHISKGSGVSSVTVQRTLAEEPTASTGALSDGSTIYYNDKLSVSASPSAGYKIDSYTSSRTVTGDTLVAITASLVNPVAPTISSVSTGGNPYARTATFTLKNNNPYQSALYYEVSTTSGTVAGTGWTSGISSGGTTTVTKSLSGRGNYNIRVRAYSESPADSTITSSWSGYSTATYTMLTLTAPTISNATSNGAATGCSATIYNPNDVSVTIYIDIFDPGAPEDEYEYQGSFTLAAKTSVSKSFRYASGIKTGTMYITAYAAASYYNSSSRTSVSFSSGGTEETTTV